MHRLVWTLFPLLLFEVMLAELAGWIYWKSGLLKNKLAPKKPVS